MKIYATIGTTYYHEENSIQSAQVPPSSELDH